MKEFTIRLTSVQDVQDFVALATSRPFRIMVGDDHHLVNGKSFMELFCLDIRQPVKATADCSEEDFQQLCRDAQRFLAK